MDHAIITSAVTIFFASALSYVLVRDSVVAIAPAVEPALLPAEALAYDQAAD